MITKKTTSNNIELIPHVKDDEAIKARAKLLLSRLLLDTLTLLSERIRGKEASPSDVNNAIRLLKDNDIVINTFNSSDKLENLEKEVKAYDENIVEYIESFK